MATTTTNATDFPTLDEWMGGKDDRPYANNTRAQRRPAHPEHGDAIAIRLHATDVVTFYRDGFVRVATGGWNSMTTWDRIRGALPNVQVAEGQYLYRVEAPGYIHPTNDAEYAQCIDGVGGYRALDCTFDPRTLPVITATGRSLTMRPCGEGRHQGEARIGGWDGPVLHYAAVREGKAWTLYRSESPDDAGVIVGGGPTLRKVKRQAWEDASSRGYDA